MKVHVTIPVDKIEYYNFLAKDSPKTLYAALYSLDAGLLKEMQEIIKDILEDKRDGQP